MLSDVEIIKGDLGHVFELQDLEERSLQGVMPPWSLITFLDSFKNDIFKCYIMRQFNELVGYIAFNDLGSEYEILRLVIDDKYRRAGCATQLLQFLANLADLNDVKDLILDVSHVNRPAMLLYARFGFVPDGYRKDYYAKDEDAVLMRKKL